jgi:hypothetical protein
MNGDKPFRGRATATHVAVPAKPTTPPPPPPAPAAGDALAQLESCDEHDPREEVDLEPAPDRNDIYVRALNVMRGGLRTEQIDDCVIVDWWTDSLGVEHVAGVEVLDARGVEINGVDIAKGRAHGTGPAVARPTPPKPRTTFGPCPACDQDFDVCKGLAEHSSATCCEACAEFGRHRTHARTTQEA